MTWDPYYVKAYNPKAHSARLSIMVQYNMPEFISCIQCQGTMSLEDRGDVLDAIDVTTVFGYCCLTCGHVEPCGDGLQLVENPKLVADQLEVWYSM